MADVPGNPSATPPLAAGPPAGPPPTISTRYFVMKSLNFESLQLSVANGQWSTQRHNQDKLNEAFTQGVVVLVFSVNMSGHFQGYAIMRSPVTMTPSMGGQFGGNTCQVEWKVVSDLPFRETEQVINTLNDNKPVRISRDGQELNREAGQQLITLFAQHVAQHGNNLETIRMALISNGVGRGTSMINPAMMATAGMLPGFGGPGVPPEMGMMMAGNMGMTPDMAALMMGGVMSNAMGGGVFPGSMGGVVVPPGFGGAGGMMLAENAEGIGGMRMGGPPAGLPFPGGVPRPPPPRGGPPGFGGPMRGRGGGWREDGGYGGGRYGRPRSRSPPRRRGPRPNLLDMNYDEYLEVFQEVLQARKQEQEAADAAAAASVGSVPNMMGVMPHMMTEAQYLDMCRASAAASGGPFDEAMVKQYYAQMKAYHQSMMAAG